MEGEDIEERLSRLRNLDRVEDFKGELRDRFGPIPLAVDRRELVLASALPHDSAVSACAAGDATRDPDVSCGDDAD